MGSEEELFPMSHRLALSHDVLLHVLLDSLVHETLHMHVLSVVCHILVGVHLVRLQDVAQEVVHQTGEQGYLQQ